MPGVGAMHRLAVVAQRLLREALRVAAGAGSFGPSQVDYIKSGRYLADMSTISLIISEKRYNGVMPEKTKAASNQSRQAIIWGRFSSDQQKDGDSESRQNRLNRACASKAGITVIQEHFDPARSVKDGSTELFKKVIAELPPGVGIICENLDRISRGHPWRAKALLAEILEAGHFVITSQDGREYNSESIEEIETMLMGDMSANLARAENNKRTKRVKEAKAAAVQLAREGKPAPFGSWLPTHIKYNPATKTYDINKDRQKLLTDIFKDYASGKGVRAICKSLNESGVPTFRRSRQAGKWLPSSIFSMLRFEGLIGVLKYKDERIPNAWPACFDEELFYKVQAILSRHRGGRYESKNVNNILRGICKCKHCGSTMTVTKDNYIYCSGSMLGRCKIKTLKKWQDMEFSFARWLVPLAAEKLLGKDSQAQDITALEAKRESNRQQREDMLELLLSKGLSVDIVSARLVKLEAEKNSIENEIAQARSKQATNSELPTSLKYLATWLGGIIEDQAIRKQVSMIIPSIVDKVEVDLSVKGSPSMIANLVNGDAIEWCYKPGQWVTDFDGKQEYIDGDFSSYPVTTTKKTEK